MRAESNCLLSLDACKEEFHILHFPEEFGDVTLRIADGSEGIVSPPPRGSFPTYPLHVEHLTKHFEMVGFGGILEHGRI
ncbi:hypothetical protein NL676_029198 [Syzygium grande]|nr:hypothetical protein NL676_029198 [Syzygium grande]